MSRADQAAALTYIVEVNGVQRPLQTPAAKVHHQNDLDYGGKSGLEPVSMIPSWGITPGAVSVAAQLAQLCGEQKC